MTPDQEPALSQAVPTSCEDRIDVPGDARSELMFLAANLISVAIVVGVIIILTIVVVAVARLFL
ncbi:MAG: hypothetical protein QM713_17000 [Arachnia sp.]